MDDKSVDEQGRCVCQLCNKPFHQITPTHLLKSHQMTTEAYRQQFPEATLTSTTFRAKQRYSHTEVFKSRPLVEEIEDQVSLEELDDEPCFTHVEELEIAGEFEKVGEPITKQVNLHIPRGKAEILSYLRMLFPNIQDNYIIDKINSTGHLVYQIVTDIADPVRKLDFEFPNAFWHNPGWPDPARDFKLLNDGWKILSFDSVAPALEDIQKKIDTVLDKD